MKFWCLILAYASLFTFINGKVPICTEPKNVGTGMFEYARYWYDKSDGTCKSFRFGGQGGNRNNFVNIETCYETCICDLPLVNGIGQANLDRFYYDKGSKTCKPMVYGGSQGNENNFLTLEKCQKTCMDICKLASDNKNIAHWRLCRLDNCLTRHSYDSQTGKCQIARFRKNDPKNWNGNSFKTRVECLGKCACKYQKNVTKASQSNNNARWYLDGNTQECQLGLGNINSDNSFWTSYECNGACVCNLPPDSGSGQIFSNRYFYNPSTKECETFSYGGTGGNANNFIDLDSCILKCVCSQKLEYGTGSGQILRYHFDQHKGCKAFAFKGKGGNENNFETYQKCTKACGICKTDPNPKPKASKTYYYFDMQDKTCKAFANGQKGQSLNNFESNHGCIKACGCNSPQDRGSRKGRYSTMHYFKGDQCHVSRVRGRGGSMNRFSSTESCQFKCQTCGLPLKVGNGTKNEQRFYFNTFTGKCEEFIYKGNDGNGNSFSSSRKCKDNCICKLPKEDGDYVSEDIQKYYFNVTDCLKLEKGYEGGNANSFKTLADCRATCK